MDKLEFVKKMAIKHVEPDRWLNQNDVNIDIARFCIIYEWIIEYFEKQKEQA